MVARVVYGLKVGYFDFVKNILNDKRQSLRSGYELNAVNHIQKLVN